MNRAPALLHVVKIEERLKAQPQIGLDRRKSPVVGPQVDAPVSGTEESSHNRGADGQTQVFAAAFGIARYHAQLSTERMEVRGTMYGHRRRDDSPALGMLYHQEAARQYRGQHALQPGRVAVHEAGLVHELLIGVIVLTRILAYLLQLAAEVTGLGRFAPTERAVWRRLLFFQMMLLAREGWTLPTPHPLASSCYDRIGRAVALVLSSQEPISVAEAAEACCMSQNAFCRTFRAATGSTFARYCLLHRPGTAAQQLLYTDKPIKALAAEWGFGSASHFCGCFRKHYRCSPAEYRRQRLASIAGPRRLR